MAASSTTPRPHHEIPNPVVLDVATQFHAGYRVLRKQPQDAGVLLPSLHNAAVAIELYLKSLSAREVEVKESSVSEVVTIYATAPKPWHGPKRLLELAPAFARAIVEEELAKCPRLNRYGSVAAALEAHAKLFTSSRYAYEQGSTFDGVTMEGLDELLSALESAVKRIPPTYVSY